MLQDKHVAALRSGLCLASAFSFLAGAQAAEHQLATKSNDPKVAVASDEGENAIKGFVPQPGFKVELFAAEPHLANPVAFSIDNKNHFYVVETFRLHAGVTDIRGIMPWLDEDLAARTVEDRLAEMKRHLGDKYADYSKETDRVKRIEDRNGDGKADFSTVFADGFNHPADGLAAGVLARKGDVWFANIPHLWLLKDTNNDGVADTRKSLHYGFGVRAGFLGHDLHGLRFGPDGKIYFSIGDRGANIQVGDKRLGHPDCGSVFRCYPDGSELEEVAFGLRNPQELAFDDHGNLFTGDNNSDGGDKARWVYVVEGGDSGWRIGYQFLENPNARGPWNAEKLWHPQWDGQAAYLLPPIANVTDGPSGLAYYPGTGLPDRYQGHFFLCDFHGGKGSGIVSFGLKPNGATFELTDKHNFIWEILPTDVEFGVDGGIYYSDWVRGWNMTGKGRIYHIYQPEAQKQPVVAETKRLLLEGMEKRSLKELAGLLAHRNQRVRQEAQFELADRGSASLKTLAEVARKNPNQLARLHAIWGLGQIDARFKLTGTKPGLPAALEPLLPLLADSDAEVRGQAAKLAGDRHLDLAYDALLKLLHDPAPRARFFAANALGKLGRREALPAILTMIRENADQDRYLRHAGMMALTGIGDFPAILAAAKDPSPAVRMAALLSLRRMERSEISLFLQDSNPALVLEAARAINDLPISGAMPELAAVLDRSDLSEWLARRAINANLRANTAETAHALATYAAKGTAPANLRAEAINTLADWPKASGRDRVTGMWRPVASAREAKHPADALRPAITELLRQAPDAVRVAAVQAADRLQLTEALGALRDIAGDQKAGANVRVAALRALAGLSDEKLPDYLNVAGNDGSSEVRQEALRLSARVKPSGAVAKLSAALADGTIQEKQSALATLGSMTDPAADKLLGEWLVRLLADQVPGELKLDLLEAAAKRNQPALKEKLETYESRRSKDDALASYREVLSGGNAEAGKKIFLERADVACVKCHKAGGEGGEVGPNLAGVATRQNREYLLESVVLPNKKIAAGFETLIVVQKEGPAYAGVLKSENDKEIVINSPEDGLVTVKKSDIKRRERGQSGMPEGMGTVLTKVELRDLIEFLGSLK